MGRTLLFAMIGGGLVVLAWLALGHFRALKRQAARLREIEAQVVERERQARLEPGGHPDHPIEVVSVAVVEPRAASLACARCQGPVRVADHQARTLGGRRLRVALLECGRCGSSREVFFRLTLGPD